MHIKQTDGAIAAEMLTATIQKMIYFLKTNKSQAPFCQRPTHHRAYNCLVVDRGGSSCSGVAFSFPHELCNTESCCKKFPRVHVRCFQ